MSLKNVLNSVIFEETFASTDAIAANGGSIAGTPTVANDEPVFFGGLDLDGTNDYLTYNAESLFAEKGSISIEIWFKPDFAYDEAVERAFFDSSAGSQYFIRHLSNGVLNVFLGGTDIGNIGTATYSGSWNQNAINHIVIASTSGDTDVYLNNTQIMTADNTAWSIKNPAQFFIGAFNDASGKFDGTHYTTRIYDKKLTAGDVSNLYNAGLGKGTLFKDLDGSGLVLHAPCISSYNDGSERPLLNTNYDYPSTYTATMGDGSTSTTYPTVNIDGHYAFDGGDYVNLTNNDNYNFAHTDAFSLSAWINYTISNGDRHVICKALSAGTGRGYSMFMSDGKLALLLRNDWGTSNQIFVDSDNTFPVNNWMFITATYDGSVNASGVKLYVDGEVVASAAATDALTATIAEATAPVNLGGRNDTPIFVGDMKDARIYNYELSPLQIERMFLAGPNNTNL